jgi:hypothetical protein
VHFEAGNGYVPSDFSDDVGDESKALVNHALYLRGNIITSYAHIEFLLADICLKAWQLDEYAHLAGAFPYKTDSRIKAVRALFEGEGPLKRYREGTGFGRTFKLRRDDAEEWKAAMQALLLVAEHDGPTMFARIGVMRALNRGYVREFDPSHKEYS